MVFTAASVAAKPVVILVDLEETFPTSIGSSGHHKSPDERSLTACRRIHMEMPVGEVCFRRAQKHTSKQGFGPFRLSGQGPGLVNVLSLLSE